jgi:hypothetical protein
MTATLFNVPFTSSFNRFPLPQGFGFANEVTCICINWVKIVVGRYEIISISKKGAKEQNNLFV